jgi:hypothetical protein
LDNDDGRFRIDSSSEDIDDEVGDPSYKISPLVEEDSEEFDLERYGSKKRFT